MLPLALLAATAATCPAPTVRTSYNPLLPEPFASHSRWIRPDRRRLHAVMWAGRAVDGRFSVYAGGVNPLTGINEKIMWVVPGRAVDDSTGRLDLTWSRGDRRYKQRYGGGATNGDKEYPREGSPRSYPSILTPPSPGCWTLRVTTGRIDVSMSVIVTAPPATNPSTGTS